MNLETMLFFDRQPGTLPLNEAAEDALRAIAPDMIVDVQKTQVTFRQRRVIACVSLPLRRIKGRPALYILVIFRLPYRIDDPRIPRTVESVPNRWTHHVAVAASDDVDAQLIGWPREAYDFSMR